MSRHVLWPILLTACGSSDPTAPDAQDAGDAATANDVVVVDSAKIFDASDAEDAAVEADASAASKTGTIIPLYTYPTDGTWAAVIAAKQANPTVEIVAIINPDSGPGSSKSSDYATGITSLQNANIIVVGYVPTGYGTSSYSAVASVEAEIHDYATWYSSIQGIFFDEMSSSASEQTYYQTLATYVATQNLPITIGNPGTTVPSALVGIFTNLVIYESKNLPAATALDTYPAQGLSYISYGVSALPDHATMSSLDGWVRWAFVTDLDGSNPYGKLPTYFAAEIAALGAL